MSLRIRFLVAGGAGIGLGHVMRTAVVASEAQRQQYDVTLVLRGDDAAQAALAAELPEVAIEPWGAPASAVGNADRIAIDAPGDIRPELAEARVRGVPTLVIDRLDVLDEADATVLPVLHAPTGSHPRLRQGAAYLLLAPAVRAAARAYPDARTFGLITMGGADPLPLTARLAEAALTALAAAQRDLPLHVVIGPAFAFPDTLERHLVSMGIVVHQGLRRPALAALMAQARFALAGFGTSLYDLAAIGTPVVYWTHRTADVADARRLEQRGLGVCGGDGAHFSLSEARAVLTRTVCYDLWCQRASARGRDLIGTGNGARQVLQQLVTLRTEATV